MNLFSWCFTILQVNLLPTASFFHFQTARSSITNCTTGVPQGSVLEPVLFSIFVSPIAHSAFVWSQTSEICSRLTTVCCYFTYQWFYSSVTTGGMLICIPHLVLQQWLSTKSRLNWYHSARYNSAGKIHPSHLSLTSILLVPLFFYQIMSDSFV